jgi:NAD(P)-dependent dehydrogenase (short-subunit alcohol dehydrogenase family)
VSSWESQAAAFERVFAQQGRVDVVFANAGITEKGSLLPEKDGKLTKPELATINVNFVGVVYSMSSPSPPFPLSPFHYYVSIPAWS